MKTKIIKITLVFLCLFCISSAFAQITTNFNFGFSFSDPNGSSHTYKIYVRAIGNGWTSSWYTEPAVTGLPSNWGPGTYTCSVTITTYGDRDEVNYCRLEVLILRDDNAYRSNTSGWYSWSNPINVSTINVGSF